MEVINNNKLYQKFLLNLLNKENNDSEQTTINQLKINIYLVLLSLNNHNYKEEFILKKYRIIDEFLRKINNLKVKIQLKRKETEIDKLISEITDIYQKQPKIISKYNDTNLDIITIINSKEAKEITILIDKLTKIKIRKEDTRQTLGEKRTEIENIIFKSDYYIKDNDLCIINNDEVKTFKLADFYEMFDYLLDVDNYQSVFLNEKINCEHIMIINELIKLATSDNLLKDISCKQIIPIIFTYLLPKKILDLNNLDTSNFKITNIKITDLYSFASSNNQDDNSTKAKWQKIIIPNEYLYQKITDLVQKGMYYYQEDNFTLENIDNKTSDFKISIKIDKITELLTELINKHLELV